MPKVRDEATGKFMPGFAPLVWEKANQEEISVMPSGKTEAAGVTIRTTSTSGEPVLLIGVGQRRGKKYKRSDRCSKCGCELDNRKSYYCRSCRADYMRERRAK